MTSVAKHKTVAKALSVLLALTICLIGINNAVFTHYHRLADGSLISHSHPYDASEDSAPVKKHSHASAEILFLHSLEIFYLCVAVVAAIIFATQKRFALPAKTPFYARIFASSLQGRAPPLQ